MKSETDSREEVPHELAAEWIHTLPGYRELIKQRVSDARKRQLKQDHLVYLGRRRSKQFPPQDVDELGREVEGCG